MSMELQKTIVDLRKEKGFTQERLAEMLGVTTAAVSKWECGNSYPDITILPQIAEIFNVSLDYLFNYHTTFHKTISDVIAEANCLVKNANREDAITLISKTLARYPNNDHLIFELARHKMIDANDKTMNERQVLLQEAEKAFHIVIENTKNDSRRAWAYQYLTTIALVQNDYDKARSYNNHIIGTKGLHPKVDRAIIELRQYDNTDALRFTKETMYENIVEFALMVTWILNYHLLHQEADKAINEVNRAVYVLEMFNENELFDQDLAVFYEGMAWAYAKKEDNENALLCLEDACNYAVKYDNHDGTLTHNIYGMMQDTFENEEKISAKKLLLNTLESDERREYDPIRDSARFVHITEKLGR